MIEISGQNKISINKLVIKDGDLPPFDFSYHFIESSEFYPRQNEWNVDPIREFKFAYDKDNKMAGLAKRKSNSFDIYFNGNCIDSPTTLDSVSG